LVTCGTIRNKIAGHGKEEKKAKDMAVVLNDKLVEFVFFVYS
jgi:hypothetical protein